MCERVEAWKDCKGNLHSTYDKANESNMAWGLLDTLATDSAYIIDDILKNRRTILEILK